MKLYVTVIGECYTITSHLYEQFFIINTLYTQVRTWPGKRFSLGVGGVDDFGHNTTATAKLSFQQSGEGQVRMTNFTNHLLTKV